jgi:hypothetical protein
MFRFTTLFVLTITLLVGVSMVPSAKADERSGNFQTYYVTVYNDTDLVVRAWSGRDSVTLGRGNGATLAVDLDTSGNGCVHAETLDRSKHWEEPVRGPAVHLNP